jgi:hypothetical protein
LASLDCVTTTVGETPPKQLRDPHVSGHEARGDRLEEKSRKPSRKITLRWVIDSCLPFPTRGL